MLHGNSQDDFGVFLSTAPAGRVIPPQVWGLPYHSYLSAALASGNGQTADLAGPAIGYVRVYDSVHVVASALASGLTNVTVKLLPNAQVLKAAQTGTATLSYTNPVPLHYGESLRVTNGGNNAGRIQASYIDIPAAGITAIRATLDATGVSCVPVSDVGFVNRLAQLGASAPAVHLWNADAVDHSFELLIGSTLVSRTTVVAGAVGVVLGPTQFPITTELLNCKLAAAVNTLAPQLLWSYETLPV